MHSDTETAQNFHLFFLQCQVKIQCLFLNKAQGSADWSHKREKEGRKGYKKLAKKLEKKNISDDSSL